MSSGSPSITLGFSVRGCTLYLTQPEPVKSDKKLSAFGNWIDESNLLEVTGRLESGVDPNDEKMKVACLTTDFPLQNVLLHMKMNLSSIDGLRITNLRTFILRCRLLFFDDLSNC